jgi:hypothetical protein
MKKYFYEAAKNQWEKPTEPRYMFCATAKVTVYADSEEEAKAKAEAKLREEYLGSGVILGPVKLMDIESLPTDWSYGYGDSRKSGSTADIGDLVGDNVIR